MGLFYCWKYLNPYVFQYLVAFTRGYVWFANTLHNRFAQRKVNQVTEIWRGLPLPVPLSGTSRPADIGKVKTSADSPARY